jgi:uncharacterized phiE125 gp8 family phage protein
MRICWTQSASPNAIWSESQLAHHCNIDFQSLDPEYDFSEHKYLRELQDAAVEFAETAMNTSLLTRTITATFNGQQDVGFYYNIVSPNDHRLLPLPRGPVQNIVSITDAKGNHPSYVRDGVGNIDMLRMTGPYVGPLTVVYTAGYGTDPRSVPADIRHAIRGHVGHLHERRESATDRTITAVPHFLEAFYASKRRLLT